jgi:hypothetical protein
MRMRGRGARPGGDWVGPGRRVPTGWDVTTDAQARFAEDCQEAGIPLG